eukprot:3985127-Pleurochrysis_carterae.AAC.1
MFFCHDEGDDKDELDDDVYKYDNDNSNDTNHTDDDASLAQQALTITHVAQVTAHTASASH